MDYEEGEEMNIVKKEIITLLKLQDNKKINLKDQLAKMVLNKKE